MAEPFDFSTPKQKKINSGKQEKRWAKKVKGRQQPASGALWGAKGDVKEARGVTSLRFLWDNKYTIHKSYGISIETWNKIKEEAVRAGCTPGLQLEFQDLSGKPILKLVVIEEDDFFEMRGGENNE
jgi:hypothetical protein